MGQKTLQVFPEHPQQRLQVMGSKPAGLSRLDPVDVTLREVPAEALGYLTLRETELIS
jgi:hypothetical protein